MESSVFWVEESIMLTVPCPERKCAVQFENCPKAMFFQVHVRPVPAGRVCTILISTLFMVGMVFATPVCMARGKGGRGSDGQRGGGGGGGGGGVSMVGRAGGGGWGSHGCRALRRAVSCGSSGGGLDESGAGEDSGRLAVANPEGECSSTHGGGGGGGFLQVFAQSPSVRFAPGWGGEEAGLHCWVACWSTASRGDDQTRVNGCPRESGGVALLQRSGRTQTSVTDKCAQAGPGRRCAGRLRRSAAVCSSGIPRST